MSVFRNLLMDQDIYTELEYFTVNRDVNIIFPFNYSDDLDIETKLYLRQGNCTIMYINTGVDNGYLVDYWGGYVSYFYNNRPQVIRYSLGYNKEAIIETKKQDNKRYVYVRNFNGTSLASGNKALGGLTGTQADMFGSPGADYALSGNFYYLTAKDSNGDLVYNYVPVLDKNNVVCMYDKVNKVFAYPSEYSTGTPVAGPIKQ